MRDITLLGFTLRAMRDLGGGRARIHRDGGHHQGWFAGPQPLNAQVVQDLISDGWLRRVAGSNEVRINAWPSFAGSCSDKRSQLSGQNAGCPYRQAPQAHPLNDRREPIVYAKPPRSAKAAISRAP